MAEHDAWFRWRRCHFAFLSFHTFVGRLNTAYSRSRPAFKGWPGPPLRDELAVHRMTGFCRGCIGWCHRFAPRFWALAGDQECPFRAACRLLLPIRAVQRGAMSSVRSTEWGSLNICSARRHATFIRTSRWPVPSFLVEIPQLTPCRQHPKV